MFSSNFSDRLASALAVKMPRHYETRYVALETVELSTAEVYQHILENESANEVIDAVTAANLATFIPAIRMTHLLPLPMISPTSPACPLREVK